jgi:Flp pilus assembly protein TadG
MNRPDAPWLTDQRGVAAIEFALIAPVLLFFLGGIVDFGLLTVGRSQLANGVAQATQYALLQGPSVTFANVQAMVLSGSARAGLTAVVTPGGSGPACYCVTGEPAALVTPSTALTGTFTCTGTCPTPQAAPGAVLTITGSFVYQPLMPFYSRLANTTVSESATVRLQ